MSKFLLTIVMMLFVSGGVFLTTKTASAQDLGSGPGCSAIEGLNIASLSDNDFFVGIINRVAVLGSNHKGKGSPDNSDTDAFSDSLEMCINDALVGFCSTIFGDDPGCYTLSDQTQVSRNRYSFKITFLDVAACCATSACSDHVDNDLDGFRDFGGAEGFLMDPECTDYDDNDESVL